MEWKDKLHPQEIICREDGSMILIGSSYWGHVAYSSDFYEYGFIASYIDASGKLIWTKNIFNKYTTKDQYRPFLVGNDCIYVLSDIPDYTQKTKDRVPRNIILSKISFDGKQTDKIILKGVDKIINLMLPASGKTLIAEVAYGYTINKEKSKQKLPEGASWISDITDQIVTVTLK